MAGKNSLGILRQDVSVGAHDQDGSLAWLSTRAFLYSNACHEDPGLARTFWCLRKNILYSLFVPLINPQPNPLCKPHWNRWEMYKSSSPSFCWDWRGNISQWLMPQGLHHDCTVSLLSLMAQKIHHSRKQWNHCYLCLCIAHPFFNQKSQWAHCDAFKFCFICVNSNRQANQTQQCWAFILRILQK